MSSSVAARNQMQARTLVDGLVAGGVRHVVISPGSRSTPLVLAWASCPEVSAHAVLDERTAGFVALGLARACGHPTALVCTSGSAPAHYLPAVLEAAYDRVPLLIMTADRPPELHGCGALQSVDQAHLYGRHVRDFVDIGTADTDGSTQWLRQVAARCFDAACRPPRGPVHINIPLREPLWTAEVEDAPSGSRAVSPLHAEVLRSEPMLGPDLVRSLAARLSACERGAIVCGPMPPVTSGGPGWSLAQAVRTLGAALAWPVLAEPTSQVRFGTATEPVLSASDVLVRAPVFADGHRPDLVLRFGSIPTSKAMQAWLAAAGSGSTGSTGNGNGAESMVLVDEGGGWPDPGHTADTLVVADPVLLARALAAEMARGPARGSDRRRGWLVDWQQADARACRALEHACSEGFWEGGIVRELVRRLPDDSALHVASSTPIRDLDAFSPAHTRQVRVHANRGTSGIDGTIATATGEALGDRDRVQFALMGDLAFLHDVGSLRAAVHLGAAMILVVIDNGGGGIFSSLPIAAHPTAFEPYFLMPQEADLAALTQAAGATWQEVASYDALRAALEKAAATRAGPGVHVIGARVDRERSWMQRRQALAAAIEAASA